MKVWRLIQINLEVLISGLKKCNRLIFKLVIDLLNLRLFNTMTASLRLLSQIGCSILSCIQNVIVKNL